MIALCVWVAFGIPVLSSDRRWLAVMDQTYFYVRIYDL